MNKLKGSTVLELHTIKQEFHLQAAYKHITRQEEVLNADASKTQLNVEFTKNGHPKNVHELLDKRLKEAGIDKNIMENDRRVKAVEFLFSFSREMIGIIDVYKWAEDTYDWLKNRYGEKNVLTCNLHLDESVPHIHAMIVPITDKSIDGKKEYQHNVLCATAMLGNKKTMRDMHTDYHVRVGNQHGLERGLAYHISRQRSRGQFYAMLSQCDKQAHLPEKESSERRQEYDRRIDELYEREYQQYKSLMEREFALKALREKVREIQKEVDVLEKEQLYERDVLEKDAFYKKDMFHEENTINENIMDMEKDFYLYNAEQERWIE